MKNDSGMLIQFSIVRKNNKSNYTKHNKLIFYFFKLFSKNEYSANVYDIYKVKKSKEYIINCKPKTIFQANGILFIHQKILNYWFVDVLK